MLPARLLEEINARHDTVLRLNHAYAGGEQGAIAIADEAGTPLVMKWGHDRSLVGRFENAKAVTDALRPAGYPVPRYRYGGVIGDVSYTIHEALPGQPLGTLTLAHLPRLLELNRLQRGRSPLPRDDWTQRLIDSVTVGCGSYCLPESLDAYTPETRTLLARLQSMAALRVDTVAPAKDIVHFDFHPGNILVHAGVISGVIDWDGVCSGDSSFDLVTLLFYAGDAEVRQVLWKKLHETSSPGAIELAVAHVVVRQIDWSIRHHTDDVVASWLDRATIVITECDRRISR